MRFEKIYDRAFDNDRRRAKRAANYARKCWQKARRHTTGSTMKPSDLAHHWSRDMRFYARMRRLYG